MVLIIQSPCYLSEVLPARRLRLHSSKEWVHIGEQFLFDICYLACCEPPCPGIDGLRHSRRICRPLGRVTMGIPRTPPPASKPLPHPELRGVVRGIPVGLRLYRERLPVGIPRPRAPACLAPLVSADCLSQTTSSTEQVPLLLILIGLLNVSPYIT